MVNDRTYRMEVENKDLKVKTVNLEKNLVELES